LLLPVRVIIFAVVWLLTWGKVSFWLFPNLTEDVGFFDSFRPLYQSTFAKSESGEGDVSPASGTAGEGSEPAEDAGGKEDKSKDHVEELENGGDDDEDEVNADEDDSGDENIRNSSDDDEDVNRDDEPDVGNNDNGYEMISAKDVENGDHGDAASEEARDEDGAESRPNVRRRKGKRRIT